MKPAKKQVGKTGRVTRWICPHQRWSLHRPGTRRRTKRQRTRTNPRPTKRQRDRHLPRDTRIRLPHPCPARLRRSRDRRLGFDRVQERVRWTVFSAWISRLYGLAFQ